jgi:hypothetical protein
MDGMSFRSWTSPRESPLLLGTKQKTLQPDAVANNATSEKWAVTEELLVALGV